MLKESRQIILRRRLSDSIAPFSLKILTHQIQKLVFDRFEKMGLYGICGISCYTSDELWRRIEATITSAKDEVLTAQEIALSLVLGPWCYYETTILWINNWKCPNWEWGKGHFHILKWHFPHFFSIFFGVPIFGVVNENTFGRFEQFNFSWPAG